MKKLIALGIIFAIILVALTGYLFIKSQNPNLTTNTIPTTNNTNTTKTTNIMYQGIQIPLGFSQNPIFGKPTFTGVISKYETTTANRTILQFKNSDQTFAFDPTTLITTNYSDPNITKIRWSVPTPNDLKNLLSTSKAVTLKFDDLSIDQKLSASDLASEAAKSTFSIIFYTY